MTATIKSILCGILLVFLVRSSEAQYDVSKVASENAPRLSPNTTEEMQHPEFWIANIRGNPDRVILTAEQIADMNRKNSTKSYDYKDINGKPYTLRTNTLVEDPLSIRSFPGDSLRVLIKNNLKGMETGTYYDFRKKKYEDDVKKKITEQGNADAIPDIVTPRYGILVAPSTHRYIPTHNERWREQNGWISSTSFNAADAASPVAILHTSRDGDWYYVRSEFNFGWIPALDIATGSEDEIRNYVEARDFIMVTTGKVPVYSDNPPYNFLMDLYMGARVRLVSKEADGFHVLVPFRKPDGTFQTVPGRVKPDAGVCAGYQPFTQRNIINTFFAKLNDPWSGGDAYEARHCCGTVRGVLRTFGIKVMDSTTFQLHASDHVISYPKETPSEVKYKYLRECEPAITLLGSGDHVILYLGEVNGRHYVIHSTGYDYKRDDGTVMLLRRVNVNDTELEGGSQVNTWTYMCQLKP
ncbi:SH3 domain-containing protein [bacterium]|nr:SH3 domain-containing protein [bacterium]